MLESVLPLNGPNTPGGCKLQVIPEEYVVYVPPEAQSRIGTAITIVGGNWIDMRGTLWTQEFEEVWDRRSGTLIARASVALSIPKDELPKLDQFADLGRQRFLVLHYDRNGTVKLMGTREEPAQLTVQRLTHGRAAGDRNEYELRATVARRTKCPFYLGPSPDVGAPVLCPSLVDLIGVAPGSFIWSLMTLEQREAALASSSGAALWASMSPTQQADAVNSVSGSVLFALLTTLHQVQAINSLSGSDIWNMANGTVQGEILTAAGAAVIADIDGTTLWGMLDGTQQAAVLAAAGISTLDEVNDEEPYGTYEISDE